MHRRSWLPILLLSGCTSEALFISDQGPTPAGTDGDDWVDPVAPQSDPGAQACTTQIAWTVPAAGELLPLDAVITVGFDQPVDQETWSLDVHGLPGDATLDATGLMATFTPRSPWLPERDYDLTAEVCTDQVSHTFRTLPRPVRQDQLVGRTWLVDLADMEWVAPGVSSAFAGALGLDDIVITVELEDGLPHAWARPTMRLGSTSIPLPCLDAIDLGAIDLTESPRFATELVNVQSRVFGTDVSFGDLRIDGLFGDDGGEIGEIQVRGTLDTRDVEAITGLGDLCGLAARLGERCTPCTSDGATYCMDAIIMGGVAPEVYDIDVFSDGFDFLGLCP